MTRFKRGLLLFFRFISELKSKKTSRARKERQDFLREKKQGTVKEPFLRESEQAMNGFLKILR